MTRLIAPTLGLASLALLVASLTPGDGSAIVFGALAAAFPVALVVFAAPTEPGTRLGRPLVLSLLGLLTLLEGGLATLLALRGTIVAGSAALPLAPIVQLGALWLLPLIVVVWAYAATFPVEGSPPSSESPSPAPRSPEPASPGPPSTGSGGPSSPGDGPTAERSA